MDYDELGQAMRGMNVAVGGENDTLSKLIRKWYTERDNFDEAFNMCRYGSCKNYMQVLSKFKLQISLVFHYK